MIATELTNLVRDVKQNQDDNSYLRLKEEVQNCYFDVYHRYKYKLFESGVSRQDSFDDLDLVLLKSVNTYDESKNTKFSTHFMNYSFYHFKSLLSSKESARHRFTTSLEYDDYDILNFENMCSDDNNPEQMAEFSDLRKKILTIVEKNLKNKKQKLCVIEKYFSGDAIKSNTEIAEKLGIDRKYVSELVREATKKIKDVLRFEEILK